MTARPFIENALARYAFAYDTDELELLAECFTRDAEVEFSSGLKVGRDAVVAEMARRRARYRPDGVVPWHVISNVFIREESDEQARVASFYTFAVRSAGQAPKLQSMGYYDDLFVPEDGVWRVHRRRVVAVGEA